MTNLFKGLHFNTLGLKYFWKHKNLWKFVLLPLVINFFILVLFVFLVSNYFQDIYHALVFRSFGSLDVVDPQGLWQHFYDGVLWVFRLFLKIFIFLISMIVILVLTYVLSVLINSPFYELLSENVLIQKGVRQEKPFQWKEFWYEILHSWKAELAKVLFFIFFSVLLFVLSFVPVLGVVVAFCQILFSSWFFAFGICAYPLILKKEKISSLFKWGLSHKMILTGFGLPSLIPLIGLALMPFQIVGGTLLYAEVEAK